jgi:hypothetical protein
MIVDLKQQTDMHTSKEGRQARPLEVDKAISLTGLNTVR